jgi:hypothetical protein
MLAACAMVGYGPSNQQQYLISHVNPRAAAVVVQKYEPSKILKILKIGYLRKKGDGFYHISYSIQRNG